MLTEVEKKSGELSVCSNNKHVSARCCGYGFSTKWHTKQFSPLHLETPSFSPVCHSYHSLVVTKLSCSSFYLCEYDLAVLSESGCENGIVKSSLPFCGYTKWDQTCSRRWQNSKCCADGGGEDMLSAKSSLLFFKMSITSQMLWLAATSGCLLHFWIFTHLDAVIWLCQQGSGTCRWTNPNRNKFWEDERNQFCEDKCAAWPVWIFSSPWKLLVLTSESLSVTTSDSKRKSNLFLH